MQNVPIQALPNQQLNITLDDNQWDISIRDANGATAVTLALNGVVLVSNARVVADVPILTSLYKESGNFVFITLNQELIDYTKFAVSQSLVYISAAELAVVRTKTKPYVTADDFDPIAALPLRFSPTGYVLAP